MKKYKKLLVVLLCIAILVSTVPKHTVYADGMTAAMLGSVAYSIMSASGISFTAGNATGLGMETFMTNQVEGYVNSHGGSLTSLFGGEMARMMAGKLVVGMQMYNGVLNFVDWLKGKYTLNGEEFKLSDGEYGGKTFPNTDTVDDSRNLTGIGIEILTSDIRAGNYSGPGTITVFNGGRRVWTESTPMGQYYGDIEQYLSGSGVMVGALQYSTATGARVGNFARYVATVSLQNSLSWNGTDYINPQPLPQGKQWEGDFAGTPGFADPPSDLPDFLSRIPVAIANNELQVEEEIVDTGDSPPPSPTPSPTPSPRPTPAPVPEITIAQKIAAILGEFLGLIGLTGDTPLTEEQQQQIADASQDIEDSVKDIVQNITDTITQAGTETGYDIQDQTQTITQSQQQIKDAIQTQTDTLTDTLPDIKDATQEMSDTLTDTLPDIKDVTQEMTDTLTDTLPDIKEKLEDLTEVPDDFTPQKHLIVRGVFPFCIPFDLHDIIVALDADPVTPEVHIPFRIPTIMGINFGLDYTFDLDLHDFDGLAQVLRTLEFIAFGVGLLFVTGKVIKW